MATTSAFFPNTARPKRGRPERTPPPLTAATAFTPSTQYATSRAAGACGSAHVPCTLAWSAEVRPQWESIRVVLPENSSSPYAKHTGPHEPLCFPSVRTTLWDRAPLAPGFSLRPITPRIALPAALLQRLAEHALAGAFGDDQSLEAVLRVEPDQVPRPWSTRSAAAEAMLRPLSLRACALAPCDAAGRAVLGSALAANAPMHAAAAPGIGGCLAGVTDVPVRCRAWPANGELDASTADYAELLDRLDASLDGSVPLSMPEMASGHALAACSADRTQLLVRIEAIVPGLQLEVVPLYPLRVLPSALAESLLPAAGRRTAQTGYLTLEQSRKLVLLGERDPKASEVPLVGIWVSGVESVTSPHVWAAATRFARLAPPAAHTVKTQDGVAAFLCVLYPSAPHTAISPGGLASVATHAPPPAMFEMQPQSEPCSTLRLAGATMHIRLPSPSPSTSGDDAVLFEMSAAETPAFSRLIAQRYPTAPHTNAAAAAAAAALTAACMRKLSTSAPSPQRVPDCAAPSLPGARPSPPTSAAISLYSSPLPHQAPYHASAQGTRLSLPPSLPRPPPPAATAEVVTTAMHWPRPAADGDRIQPGGGEPTGVASPAMGAAPQGCRSCGDSDSLPLGSPLVSLVVELQRQLASLSSRVEQQGREAARMSQHISALESALAESEAARAAAAVTAAVAARPPLTRCTEAELTPASAGSRRDAEASRGGDATQCNEAASAGPTPPALHSAASTGKDGESADGSEGYRSIDEASDGEGDTAAFWGDDVYDEIPRIEYVPDDDLTDDDEEEEEEEEKRGTFFAELKEGAAGGERPFVCNCSDDDDEEEHADYLAEGDDMALHGRLSD